MAKEIIFLVEEDPTGGYFAKALDYPIFTQGESIEEIKQNIKDALSCHFEREEDIPKVIRLHIVREEVFSYG
jgi:predicted RNase H-like HicB family nuclease